MVRYITNKNEALEVKTWRCRPANQPLLHLMNSIVHEIDYGQSEVGELGTGVIGEKH
jgi:hypothetical protein